MPEQEFESGKKETTSNKTLVIKHIKQKTRSFQNGFFINSNLMIMLRMEG